VCCSVLQCVAVCCSVVQRVNKSKLYACCQLLLSITFASLPSVDCVLQCDAACCSVLQCVAVCCSVLHTKCCNV